MCSSAIFSSDHFIGVLLILFVLIVTDFDLDDEDTCRATVRMFLQCNLVQQFHIPYDVSTGSQYTVYFKMQIYLN